MKKILFFTLFFFSVLYANANTGSTVVNYTANSGISECGNSISHGVTHYGVPDVNLTNAGTSGTKSCTTHSYYTSSSYTGASYTPANTSLSCLSGERVIKILYYNGTTLVSTINIGGTPYTGAFTQYKIVCQKYDDTPPSISNITSVLPADGSSLLATNSQNYTFTTIPTGAPITSIVTYMEDYNTANTFSTTSSECISGCNQNISNVDKNRLSSPSVYDGGRKYTFRISKICDEAGNCVCADSFGTIIENNCASIDKNSVLKDYSYYVYANTINTTMATTKVSTNEIINTSNIADGSTKNLTITLKDIYGNQIVPAPGISRTIDINFNNTSNTMYLDQYTRSGNTSVFSTLANDSSYDDRFSLGTTTKSFDSESSSDGDYTYGFHFYTPTSNQTGTPSDINANFQIGSITFDANGSLGARINGTIGSSINIVAAFNPLYYTTIGGDLGDGIVEGGNQSASIEVTKNSSKFTSLNTLRVEFGSGLTNVVHPKLDMKYGNTTTSITNPIGEGNGLSTAMSFFPGSYSHNFYTKVSTTIPGQPIPKNPLDYFSTHFTYTIDGLSVKTNSSVIGKSSYWGTSFTSAGLAYVKVLGQTYNKGKYSETIEGQDGSDVKRLQGSITKSSLKTKMRSNAYNFVKSVKTPTYALGVNPKIMNLSSFSDTTNTSYGGVSLSKDTVLYYGGLPSDRKTVTLGNGFDLTVSGKKTIIVSGGNLYIKSNILLGSSSDILGIIVLKDSKGNYGNVYIDPGVTQIKANIYTDKSLISAIDSNSNSKIDSSEEFDGNSTTSGQLKNQLYIYGSVFSENTIGGSRAATSVCPYYVVKASCDSNTAQKYDLNYLRRYYLKSDGNPAGSGIQVKGGNLASYPLIIEYNPKLQTTPPPLFTY